MSPPHHIDRVKAGTLHLQPFGITEAADSNNPIARLHHGRSPRNLVIQRTDRHSFGCRRFHAGEN
jgi:hypothetical protein